jgi:hypothetical protein
MSASDSFARILLAAFDLPEDERAMLAEHMLDSLKMYKEDPTSGFSMQLLLYLLSIDESNWQESVRSVTKISNPYTWKFHEATFEEQFLHYEAVDLSLKFALRDLVWERITSEYRGQRLFEAAGMWLVIPTDEAKAKLREEFPDIWKSWELT